MISEIVTMPLSELHPPERNVRMHTETQLREFERSVRMFGQLRPIVADENGEILAGNGLYTTLLRLGKTEAQVLVKAGLTAAQKKKLMLADNKIFDLGVDDLEAFETFLVDLGDDLDIPGFSEDLLRSMVAQAGEVSDTLREYGTIDESEIEDIRAARERRDPAAPSAGSAEEYEPEAPAEDGQHVGDEAPTRRYVVCPNCGEKIWL